MGDRVSLREFARRLDTNPGYVHRLKELGRLVMVADEKGRGLVDVDASLALIEASKDPDKDYMREVNAKQRAAHRGGTVADLPLVESPPETPAADPAVTSQNASFLKAKTDEQVYAAKLRELEYQKAIGDVVPKVDVEKAWTGRVIRFRETLTTLSYRLSTLLAAESDPIVVQRMLQDEFRAALDDLSGRAARRPEA